MTAPLWEPGTVYLPGALVQPASSAAPVSATVTNAGFESGDVSWTKETGWTITNAPSQKYAGTWSAQFSHTSSVNRVLSTAVACSPGQPITAWCMVHQGASAAGVAGAAVLLRWLTAASAQILVNEGEVITSSNGGWKKSTVVATAPETAAFVQIGARGFRTSGAAPLNVDSFGWTHLTPGPGSGIVYIAVQAAAGTSGATEPTWPTTLGVSVVDNTVTWQAVAANRVTWTASPLMRSSGVQPTWPTVVGTFVSDGDISWECIGRNVRDTECPNTAVVGIGASKIFAGDSDIVKFSATVNPLDWSTRDDAGYLPTGVQQTGANDVKVINFYRGNLVVFNDSTFQMWQIDPDPAAMAKLDQMEGIGSAYQQAAQPIGDELFFLSQLGVRSVSNAAGEKNLSDPDIGSPVDSLVRASLATTLAAGMFPVATYYPGAGQYWLALPGE